MKKCQLMLWMLSGFVAYGGISPAVAETAWVEDYKAVFYVNKSAMVCGNVHQVKTVKKQKYLNLGGAYPKQKIAFLIWEDDRPAFQEKFGRLSALENKRVCARGTISEYKGHLQLVVKNPDFLRLMK